MSSWLALEDGTVVRGCGFGHKSTVEGELVFNTSMTGYQEAMTDPSYAGQTLMFTFPQIGNYGFSKERNESSKAQIRGCVVKEWCREPHQGKLNLDEWLKKEKIPGIEGVDTRSLTIRTRTRGTLRSILSNDESMTPEEGVQRAKDMVWPSESNLVSEVSTKKAYRAGKGKIKIALFDWGVKQSIVDNLAQRGEVTVVPWNTNFETIKKMEPDLVFLSNGPGDPDHDDLMSVVETIKEILGKYPIVGICLGHQILGLALGGETYKLPFGHRGVNQPVRELEIDRVYITSQNHGFALRNLPKNVQETFVNLNDGTCEGLKVKGAWTVQFHPEASPGPMDANELFDRAVSMAGVTK